MRQRRFVAGQQFVAGGVQFRVASGSKGSGDLRLDWCVGGDWQPVLLDAVFAVVDMVAENEDRLFPYPAKGGEETMRYLRIARIQGWQEASRLLHLARVSRHREQEFTA